MTHIIRLAREQDLPAIVAIYNSTVPGRQATADLQPVSVEARRGWFAQHQQDPHRPLYVVETADGSVAAWGSFNDYYPRAAYRITAEISLYVHPDHRRCGLARQLLAHMHRQAPALGIRNIAAVIFGHNAASIALFVEHGYRLWGTLPQVCDLDGRLADIVIYGLVLPEFSSAADIGVQAASDPCKKTGNNRKPIAGQV